jgi:hypothetical protein
MMDWTTYGPTIDTLHIGVCHNVSVLGSLLLLPSIITWYANMPHSDAMFFRTTPNGWPYHAP